MKSRKMRQSRHNKRAADQAEAQALFASQPEYIQEEVRRRIAIDFGAVMGLIFRFRETRGRGVAPHTSWIVLEMNKLGYWMVT